jgi:hypothetical protein
VRQRGLPEDGYVESFVILNAEILYQFHDEAKVEEAQQEALRLDQRNS